MFTRATLLALILVCCLAAVASAGTPEALEWLKGQQQPDGGFGEPSAVGSTIETLLAITAAGEDIAQWSEGGNTPANFLEAHVGEIEGPGPTAKAIIALRAAGIDPTDFGGTNLVQKLQDSYDEATGRFGGESGTVPAQALTIMALESVSQPVEKKAINWLVDAQTEDGSWAWNGDPATQGDTNTTSLAIQALATVDARPDAVDEAIAYLKDIQNEDAGWPYQKPSDFGTDTDTNSTAYVLQALYAVDADLADWSVDGVSSLDALASLQKDNGAFQWQAAVPDDNFLATAQAVPALAGKAYPLPSAIPTAETQPMKLPSTGGEAAPLSAFALVLAGLTLAVAGLLRDRRLASL